MKQIQVRRFRIINNLYYCKGKICVDSYSKKNVSIFSLDDPKILFLARKENLSLEQIKNAVPEEEVIVECLKTPKGVFVKLDKNGYVNFHSCNNQLGKTSSLDKEYFQNNGWKYKGSDRFGDSKNNNYYKLQKNSLTFLINRSEDNNLIIKEKENVIFKGSIETKEDFEILLKFLKIEQYNYGYDT